MVFDANRLQLPGLCVGVGNVFDPLGDEASQAPDPSSSEWGVLKRLEYPVYLEVTVSVYEQLHDATQTAVFPQSRAQLAVAEVLPVHVRTAQERRQEGRGSSVPFMLLVVLHFRVVGVLVTTAERVYQNRQHIHETFEWRTLAACTSGWRHESCIIDKRKTLLINFSSNE